MLNDLSPVCKALIGLFAAQTEPLTLCDIAQLLPHADKEVMHDTLQMLVRSDVVRVALRRISYSRERELVYWLAGKDVGTFDGTRLHYPPDFTLADVEGVTSNHEAPALPAVEAKELQILRLAQKTINSEIQYLLRGGREANHA